MIEQRLFIPAKDHDIPMVLCLPEAQGIYPCMLLLHGFMAWKEGDGYLFTKTAKALSDAGIASARIDFCSMGENRCSRERYGTEICLEEAETAFNYLRRHAQIDPERIGLLGHSMGGRITFLSSQLPSKCLVTFNGAVNVDKPGQMRLKGLDEKILREQGHLLYHTSDGRTELLFPEFADDLQIHSDAIYSYKNPILLCIGADDPTLDPQISYDFANNCGMDNVETLVIEKANHTFNAKTGDYTKVYELLDKLTPWLQDHLCAQH